MVRYFLVAAAFFLLFGCDNIAPSDTADDQDQIVPLKAGNEWVWRTTQHHRETGEDLGDEPVFETFRVLGDTLIEGEKWFVLHDGEHTGFAANKPDGHWVGAFVAPDSLVTRRWYPYPVLEGDTFRQWGWPDSTDMEVVKLDTSITVEAGTFRAVRYDTHFDARGFWATFSTYVAPGVGLVKEVTPLVSPDSGIIQFRVKQLVDLHLVD